MPSNVKIFALNGWGLPWDYVSIYNPETKEGDAVGERNPGLIKLPKIAEGHSWARYRGGYDTDNFTNDFYDEPNPTPGYENHRSKGNGGGVEIYWLEGVAGIVATSILTGVAIWCIKKGRK